MTPFSDALRTAIDARGISLVALRDRLAERGTAVSLTTLSYWRSGRRHPDGVDSLAAIRALEGLLDLPADHLAAKLGPPRRRGPHGRSALPFGNAARRRAVEQTIDALGATPLAHLHALSGHVVADVDELGRLRRCRYRVLLQVTSGTVTQVPFLEIGPAPASVSPVVTAAGGARVARSHRHPDGQVAGFVLETERPLTAPDATVLEWTVDYPPSYPELFETSCAVTRQAREVIVWVRFHPDRLPHWCEEYTDDNAEFRAIDLGTGTTAHAVRARFGPGELGVRWGFDEPDDE